MSDKKGDEKQPVSTTDNEPETSSEEQKDSEPVSGKTGVKEPTLSDVLAKVEEFGGVLSQHIEQSENKPAKVEKKDNDKKPTNTNANERSQAEAIVKKLGIH